MFMHAGKELQSTIAKGKMIVFLVHLSELAETISMVAK